MYTHFLQLHTVTVTRAKYTLMWQFQNITFKNVHVCFGFRRPCYIFKCVQVFCHVGASFVSKCCSESCMSHTHTHTLASARPPLRLLSLCVCASFLSHTCVYLRSLLHGHIKTEMFFHQMLNRCGDKQVISMLMTRLSLCEPMKLKVKHFQFQHWFFLTPLSEIKLVKLTNNELKLLKFYCICTQIRSF